MDTSKMKRARITTLRAFTLVVIGCASAAACAGDDKKNVQDGEAGAAGESGSGQQAQGGSSSLPNEGGAPGSPGNAMGGEPGGGMGSTTGGSVGNGGGGLVDGNGEAGAPATGEGGSPSDGGAASGGGAPGAAGASGEPVPSGCISCGNEFCLAAYFSCSELETCKSCRDVSFSAPECADDFFFNEYRDCLCQYCATGACSVLCGG